MHTFTILIEIISWTFTYKKIYHIIHFEDVQFIVCQYALM